MTDMISEARWIARLPEPRRARAIRMAAGLPQEVVAAAVGVHRVTLARWESGARRPSHSAAARYSQVLDQLVRAMNDEAGDAA